MKKDIFALTVFLLIVAMQAHRKPTLKNLVSGTKFTLK
jgi:hypothetical protein